MHGCVRKVPGGSYALEERPEGPAVTLRRLRRFDLCPALPLLPPTTGASAIVMCLVPSCRGAQRAAGHPRVFSFRPSPKITFTFYPSRGIVPGAASGSLCLGQWTTNIPSGRPCS